MTVILALLTILILVLLDLVKRSQKPVGKPHPAPRFIGRFGTTVIERYYHPGHCWSLVHGDDPVLVGVDDFTQRLIGPLDAIDLPIPGTQVRQGEPFITLRRGKRLLTQVAPMSGAIGEVNTRLEAHPDHVNASPYEKGWIASIAPAQISTELRNLMKGAVAERWEEAVRMQLMHFFTPRQGAIPLDGPILQDGGTLIDDIGDILTDDQWREIVHEFYPTIHHTNIEKGL